MTTTLADCPTALDGVTGSVWVANIYRAFRTAKAAANLVAREAAWAERAGIVYEVHVGGGEHRVVMVSPMGVDAVRVCLRLGSIKPEQVRVHGCVQAHP